MKPYALFVFFIVVFSLATVRASSVIIPLPGAVGSVPKTVSFDAGTSFKNIEQVRLKCSGTITYGLGCGDGVERPVYPYFPWPGKVEIYMDPPEPGIWVAEFGSSEGPFNEEKIFDNTPYATWDFLLDGQAQLNFNVNGTVIIGGIMLIPPSATVSQATMTIKGTVIDILSPSTGESLTGGSLYTISWQDYRSQSSCPYNYFLDYSIDGGQNWLAINSEAIFGSCSYDWNVPDVNYQQCKIRITDADDPNFTDTAAGYFTIHKCPTDLNGDAFVDFVDYAILSPNWQQSPDPCDPNSGDIIKNGIVDIYDLAELCADWLVCYVTQAAVPEPADHAIDTSRYPTLRWSPGKNSISHDVYFGIDFNAVDTADTTSSSVYMGNQEANYWDSNNYANELGINTTYYWRIDETGPVCCAKGDIWRFTTCPEPNIDYGLVALWKFDEANGTIAYDSAGSNNGTINGATWTTGKIDGALSFDGSNDYVSVPNNSALNITGDITISAWVHLAAGSSTRSIVAKTAGNGATNNPFDFRTEGTSLTLVRADASGHEVTYSTTPMSTQQWYHVLVRVKNKVPDFYLDGVITGKTVATFTKTPTSNTNPLYIGRRADGLYFNGKIDNVRIYNRALSADEVALLYQQGQ